MKLFYTVLLDKAGFPVRYIDPQSLKAERFAPRTFSDPGEASREFKANVAGEHCYLDQAAF